MAELSPRWFASTLSAAVAAGAIVLGAGPSQKAENPCDLSTTGRIVAIGDVHGGYQPFLTILQESKLINAEHHWIGGDTFTAIYEGKREVLKK